MNLHSLEKKRVSEEQNTEPVVLVPCTVTPTRIRAKLQSSESVPCTVERTV
jgi:hypothetical protein